MKHSLKKICLVLTVVLLTVHRAPAEDDEHLSPVGQEMQSMNRSFRKLRRQVADPAQKDANLALIASMQENVKKAKTLTPPEEEKVPQADRAKYMETYQKQLDELAQEYDALKTLIAAGNGEGATAEIKKINDLKEKSHKDLGVDLDKKK